MRKLYQYLSALLLTLLVGFALGVLATVNIDDVPRSYKLSNLPFSGVRAGDLHAVSADGLTRERLCHVSLRAEGRNEVIVDRLYVNIIAQFVPDFILELLPSGNSENSDGSLHFVGQYTELRNRAVSQVPAFCEKLVLESLNRREKLCIVSQSLIPTRDAVAYSAFKYSTWQYIPQGAMFERNDVERHDWVDRHLAEPCPTVPLPDWPVLVRDFFKLVTDRDPPTQTSARQPPYAGGAPRA